jgi:hypothetical protein
MPYTPHAYNPPEVDRSYLYRYFWAGAVCCVLTCANFFLRYEGILPSWIMGGAIGGVLASSISGRADDYFRSLCSVGHRWAMAVLSVWLFVMFVAQGSYLAVSPGQVTFSGASAANMTAKKAILFDGYLLALCLIVAFYAGYIFQWARDHLGASDEE